MRKTTLFLVAIVLLASRCFADVYANFESGGEMNLQESEVIDGDQVDGLPGRQGAGWATGWRSHVNLPGMKSMQVISDAPLREGGNYLSISYLSNGEGVDTRKKQIFLYRPLYIRKTPATIDCTQDYKVSFDIRLDEWEMDRSDDGSVIVTSVIRFAPKDCEESSELVIDARNDHLIWAVKVSKSKKTWEIFDATEKEATGQDGFYDTKFPVAMDQIYHFEIEVQGYQATYKVRIENAKGEKFESPCFASSYQKAIGSNSVLLFSVGSMLQQKSSFRVRTRFSFDSLCFSNIPTGINTPMSN